MNGWIACASPPLGERTAARSRSGARPSIGPAIRRNKAATPALVFRGKPGWNTSYRRQVCMAGTAEQIQDFGGPAVPDNHSFDVVSEINHAEIHNAVVQAQHEIAVR